MRKFVFALALAVAIFPAGAFGGKKNVVGYIQMYGNEPFTFVGFVTENGKKYSLDIAPDAKFSMHDIIENQGKKLRLTGYANEKELIGFQTLENGRFVVTKFKAVEN